MKNNYLLPTIDIVIPLYMPNNSIKLLLYCLLNQTHQAQNIIIINSGASREINNFIDDLNNHYPMIIHKKINRLNPGSARNYGLQFCKSDYVAFLDVSTFPELNWINKNLTYIYDNNLSIIFGSRLTLANSFSKKINKWSSYGNSSYEALTGTIIKIDLIKKNNLYFKNTRAGEDIEWIERAKKICNKISYSSEIYYNGLYENWLQSFFKWYNYSFAYSKIDKDINYQKGIYFFTTIYLTILGLYFLNSNPYHFVIFLTINYAFYFVYFSIIRPFRKGVEIRKLLPFNWVLIGMYRTILDLAKFPGLIYGYLKIIIKF